MASRRHLIAACAAATLVFGAVACSDGNNQATVTETQTVSQSASASSEAKDSAKSAQDSTSDQPATLMIAGAEVQGEFAPVHCQVRGNELEIEIGQQRDKADGIDIDIMDPEGTPRLDGLEVDTANVDLEVVDRDLADAKVSKDGNTWKVSGLGSYDDGRGPDGKTTDDVSVEVSCG